MSVKQLRVTPMKAIRTILQICGGIACLLPFAASLSVPAHAETVTVVISGMGSGWLGGTPFATQPFEWVLTYDTTNTSPGLPSGQALYLNPVSTISLNTTHPVPFVVSQEQGVYLDSSTGLYLASVLMSSGIPISNILTIRGTPAWSGLTAPYLATSITSADFSQFVNISTADQGTLTFDSGTVTSVSTTPYSAWAAGINWNGGDPSPEADPDQDGIVNLMEYALGGDPVSALSAPRPEPQVAGSKLQISFLRARSELIYTVQGSSDLTTWTDIPYTPVAAGATQVVDDTVNLSANTRRFLRLRVSQP